MTSCNGDAVTSRSPVLDPRKNETLDVVTSKNRTTMSHFLPEEGNRRRSRNLRIKHERQTVPNLLQLWCSLGAPWTGLAEGDVLMCTGGMLWS